MNYLELRREVKELQQRLPEAERLQITVISDMPLQPWFDLYLQKEWAKKGRIAKIQHVQWQQRAEKQYNEKEMLILWPSRDVEKEIDPENDAAGVWISPETASDPIKLFYTAGASEKKSIEYPAGSTLIDLEKLMLRIGLSQSLAAKEKRWGDRYSKLLQQKVAEAVVRAHETRQGRRKKCLVLDCDGVLWGGIVSEDGMDGISLSETGAGKRYQDFQKLVKQLNDHGIILAVCSKNDEEDVKRVFAEHSAMKLKEENIAAWSVSWQPKSGQMAELSEKLQIDLQDMVLVDDSLWELEEVRSQYPQVGAVLFEADREERAVYEKLSEYFLLKPEDKNQQNQLRVQTYADNAKREALKRNTGSFEEFLEKLQTKAEVRAAAEADLPRISDLSRRANQCTNGTRYTVEELKKLLQNGYQLQAVFVSDVYRDLGLVGCIGVEPKNKSLDLFCLSCRALGRRLEQQLLAALPPEIGKLRWQDTGKNDRLLQLIRQDRRWQL